MQTISSPIRLGRAAAADVMAAMRIPTGQIAEGSRHTGGRWRLVHVRPGPFGFVNVGKWSNIVVNEGLDDLLDVTLSGGTQDTTWFVGLKDTGTPAAADTLASHGTWAEITPYAGNRLAWVDGGVTGQSVDNTGSPAAFAINATDEVFGAFLAGVDTGSAGRLYAAGDFASSRNVINGDTLNVEATFTSAAV